MSAEFTSYIQSKGIKHIRTAYYHPQSNGGVERFNQSQKNGLRAHLAQGYSFNEALSQTLLHYSAAQHATTGVSPAKLMLGRELELPLHRLCPPTSHGGNPVVKARVREQQLKARSRFDAKKKARIPRISQMDWVRVQRPHRKNKLHTFWSQPRQVQKQLGPVTFQLSDGSSWHASRLRKVLCPSGADHTRYCASWFSAQFFMPSAPSTAASDSANNFPTTSCSVARQAYQIAHSACSFSGLLNLLSHLVHREGRGNVACLVRLIICCLIKVMCLLH